MPVHVYGTTEDEEYKWALKLKEKFESDSNIKLNEKNNIYIISSIQCHGQEQKDIDLVVFGDLKDYSTNVNCKLHQVDEEIKERTVKINNFCAVIEVKKHSPDRLIFKGTHLLVKYFNDDNKEHDVTLQSLRQYHTFKKYLNEERLWISNLIYLPNAPIAQIPLEVDPGNILFSDFDIKDFFELIFSRRPPILSGEQIVFQAMKLEMFYSKIQEWIEKLSATIDISPLDKKKIERLSEIVLKGQGYDEKLGDQLLIYRGRGGTGKTFKLLNIAKNIYDKKETKRILILTYNKSLVAEIRRLLAMMKIKDDPEESIQIMSVYQFWYKVFWRVGITNNEDDSGFDKFPEFKSKLLTFLDNSKKSGTFDSIVSKNYDLLHWNFVMIDEAQDWPNDERDLVYKLFGPNKVIIADGMDQFVRNREACSWEGSREVKKHQIVTLRKSLRQKSNLTRFIQEVSNKLEFSDWDVEDNADNYGGSVIIVEGEYTKDVHDYLVNLNSTAKNKNIDFLFCVPPNEMDKYNDNSWIANKLINWDCQVWDGVKDYVRQRGYATSSDSFRIVQYDSCRGLEGWICVNINFDRFFDYKLNTYKDKGGQTLLLTEDQIAKFQKEKILFAKRWLLIPLTRAMDTIVITIQNSNSYMGKILREIYQDNKEYIKWINTKDRINQ